MADRRRGRIGPDRLSHLPPPAPQIYAAAGRPRPVAVETLSDDARQPVAQGAARPDRPDLFQTARRAIRLCAGWAEGDATRRNRRQKIGEDTSELQPQMR